MNIQSLIYSSLGILFFFWKNFLEVDGMIFFSILGGDQFFNKVFVKLRMKFLNNTGILKICCYQYFNVSPSFRTLFSEKNERSFSHTLWM